MKKFVRTLNNIYETTKEMKIETLYVNNRKGTPHLIYDDKCTRLDFLGQVISESDNLEELCDEFRYKEDGAPVNILSYHQRCWKDKNTGIWYDYDTDVKLTGEEVSTIRGGIWNDKGFIYVTKMGKNGGLGL